MPGPSALLCREVEYGSPLYERCVALRHAVLRAPLGLDWEPGAFDGEDVSLHLAALVGDELVGTLILRPVGAGVLRMRQVAVAPGWQGQGVGTALLAKAEEAAQARGYTELVAHARATALAFYLGRGYTLHGEPFTEVGLPHREVRRALVAGRESRCL